MTAVGLHDMLASMRVRPREVVATGAGPEEDLEEDQYFTELLANRAADHQAHLDALADVPEELEDLVTVKTLPGDSHAVFRCPNDGAIGARAPEAAMIAGEAIDFNKTAPLATQPVPATSDPVPPAPPAITEAPAEGPVEGAPILNVMLHSTKAARAPLSPEEAHIKRWFDESFLNVDLHVSADEKTECVQGDLDGHKVVMSQQRMREIGLVMEDGAPPLKQEPAQLYWIQDKPAGYKDKYGVWDPVGAQWRMFPERSLVPIEQRIAPLGKGYGGTALGVMVPQDSSTFKLVDYGSDDTYTGTAIEPGLPHILNQIEALGESVELPIAGGWVVDKGHAVAYYTPHLRHVEIDASVSEAAGKKYVYGFFAREPVKPVEGKATWDLTNSVWVYPIDSGASPLQEACCDACPACSERSRDWAMSGK